MTQVFKLPDVGEGLTEAEIVSWKVKPGDTVRINDVIVEIETAKSLVELPCPYAGTVAELLAAEGQTLEVGAPLIRVVAEDSAGAARPDAEGAAESPAPAHSDSAETVSSAESVSERTSNLVGYGPRTGQPRRRPRKSTTPGTADVGTPASTTAAPEGSRSVEERGAAETSVGPDPVRSPARSEDESAPVHVLAKPPVRKRAHDLGVDLRQVRPSGAGGTITRADVESHAAAMQAGEAGTRTAPEVRETRIPIRGVRKRTAEAMVASAFTAPHVSEWVTLDATGTMELVEWLRQRPDFQGLKVSPLLVVAKACLLAARRTPEVNATWDEGAQEIVLKHDVNLGIAAATPRGLVVPNIKGADQLSLLELCRAVGELAQTAREGRTPPHDMKGTTFTITNVGVFGIDAGTPILNPGESAIIALGAVARRPWVVNDEIVPRWVTTLALSFDHRIVDGEQGSRFLADVAEIMRNPGSTLMYT